MPVLLGPLGLLALAALAIPLAIHLLRRPPDREIAFAALRWIGPTTPPRRQLRWHQLLLLMLRLLLLAVLAMLLASPVLRSAGGDTTAWQVIDTRLDASMVASTLSKSLTASEGERRWLAPGFPAIVAGSPAPSLDGQSASSLLRELAALRPADAALQVVVPSVLDGLDAQRIDLGREIDWQIVPAPAARSGANPVPAEMVTPRRSTLLPAGPDRALAPWLALLAAGLFAAERLLAARGTR